jgi:rRNA maturation RNase YbeY
MDTGKIKVKLKKILKGLGYHQSELSVLFTDDNHIAELNRRFLKREGPTNVLAFSMQGDDKAPETQMLGDVVISLDAAMRDAKRDDVSFDETIDRLLVHGLLHLLGYDHEISDQEARRMEEETERLLKIIE